MSEEEETTKYLEVLMELGDWYICKFEHNGLVPDIFGEHAKGCTRPYDGKIAHWGWEWHDASRLKPDVCWVCQAPVPPEVVGIVALMNWNNLEAG